MGLERGKTIPNTAIGDIWRLQHLESSPHVWPRMNTDLGVATIWLSQSEGAEGRNGEDDLTEPAYWFLASQSPS